MIDCEKRLMKIKSYFEKIANQETTEEQLEKENLTIYDICDTPEDVADYVSGDDSIKEARWFLKNFFGKEASDGR